MTILRLTKSLTQWVTARLDVRSEKGATAVEYGLMVALIAAVIITAVVALGNNANEAFQCTGDSIEARAKAATCP